MKLFGEVILLFGFETENSEPDLYGVWDDLDKFSEWILNNRHTAYAFEPVRMKSNNLCPALHGCKFKKVLS